MLGEVSGLPLEYLLGNAALNDQDFYKLQAEETLSSLENTEISAPQASSTQDFDNNPAVVKEKDNLRLNLDENFKATGLQFSPGGNEAFFVVDNQAGKPPSTRGERPQTVGHDSPKQSKRPAFSRDEMQIRLEQAKNSLEFAAAGSDYLSSAQASTEPSPRRYLPRVPLGGTDQDEAESLASPSVTRRGAMSPGQTSVTSGSTTASGAEGTHRRNLWWDSGADIGSDGQKPKDAITNFDTLEKSLIGNFSNLLRAEPEGKPNAKGYIGRGQQLSQLLSRLPGGQDHEDDLRQMRVHRFASSFQHLNRGQQPPQMQRSAASAGASSNTRQKPNPPANSQRKSTYVQKKSKSDTSPDGSPMRRKLKKKFGSPRRSSHGRSSSLTDLSHQENRPENAAMISSRHSVQDLSPRSFTNTSSSSSGGGRTVVPLDNQDDEIDPRILEALSTDPSSLPVEFYGALNKVSQTLGAAAAAAAASGSNSSGGPALRRNQQSQTSLNSRQSVETVITLEQLMARHKKIRQKQQNVPDSDSPDTDAEIQVLRARNGAEGSEAHSDQQQQPLRPPNFNNWMRGESDARAQSLPPPTKESKKKKNPTVDTTSEDERQKDKRSGTLDSAPIDRAKSFEYFPGESFPLQENSSSYEYLPGHMIHDTRPPTVVSNRPQGGSSSSNISPTTSPSVQSTSSNAIVSSNKKRRPRSRAQVLNDLGKMAAHLMEKSNQLHSAHVHQTMAFYTRLKDYIAFISKPSLSPSDARVKQQMADKILDLMKAEENKLVADQRPIASQLGLTPDFLDADEETEEATTRKIGGSDEADDGLLRDETNATNDFNEDQESTSTVPGFLLDDTNDIMIQKLRIGQMKKLRKEIRKLEKLEKIRLEKALTSGNRNEPPLTETELLKQIARKSDNSTVTSVSSSILAGPQASVSTVAAATAALQRQSNNYRGIEGQSASGSDNNNKTAKKLPSEQKKPTKKKKPSVALVKEFCPTPSPQGMKSSKENTHSSLMKKLVNTINSNTATADDKNHEDFGQTFPTPREANVIEKQTEKKAASSNATAIHRSNKEKVAKKKLQPKTPPPLAYYLSVPKESVVRTGIRSNEGSKENSNILANYMSAVTSTAIPSKRPKTAPAKTSVTDKNEDVITARLKGGSKKEEVQSLQEALVEKKSDFIQRSMMRVEILNQIRTQRMLHAERYRLWLDEMSKAPTRETMIFSQPPVMPKIPRLFTYREMVTQAREKYQKLPEVVYGKAVAKRCRSYQTNRLKADMYKKKLQKKVLQGRVSQSHHNQIL